MLTEFLKCLTTKNRRELFLLEKEMLDISIENADKIKNKEAFLNDFYRVEEKFDGTKLTIFRNDRDWVDDYEENWVIAFKNQILYGGEFESTDRDKTKKFSVGSIRLSSIIGTVIAFTSLFVPVNVKIPEVLV